MTDPRPTLPRIRELLEKARPPCVTLLLPCDPAREAVAHEIGVRLRNARERAEARLAELGVDPPRRRALLDALDAVADTSVPSPDVRTRALLAWESGSAGFGLPFEADERVAVGHGFALRPLLRAARRSEPFVVLRVSANRVSLHESDPDGRGLSLRDLPLGPVPASLTDALGSDLQQRSDELQLHSTTGHGRAPAFHGGGGAPSGRRTDLERFHRELGRALRERLRDERRPCVLAADHVHQAALREELKGLPLLSEGIAGNPDHRAAHDLAAEAAACVRRAAEAREIDAIAALERARARGKAVFGLEATLQALVAGRVQRLFVPAGDARPGRVDTAALRAVPAWGDEELADELAALALRHGGEVLAWEPGHPPADGEAFGAELR